MMEKNPEEYDQIKNENQIDIVDTNGENDNYEPVIEENNPSMDEGDIIEEMINKLPNNFPKAQPKIREGIAPILIELNGGSLEYYVEKLAKKTKVSKKVITEELEVVKNEMAKRELQKKEEKTVDPKVQLRAETIAKDQYLFRNRISLVKRLGVIGEDRNIGMYFLTLDSRLLPNGHGILKFWLLKIQGTQALEKSYPLSKCLEVYPESAYHLILGGSPKSLYFIEGGLKNKCLVIAEAFSFQNGNTNDSEFAYLVRSLLSEGQVTYQYLGFDDEKKRVTKIQTMEGPVSLITTTIYGRLEPQFENRLFSIHPDISQYQTKNIISITAQQSSGGVDKTSDEAIDAWKRYHEMLKSYQVIIHFASTISDYVNNCGELHLLVRRSFKMVLSVIKTVTLSYQFQRNKDEKGRLISEMSDYAIAYQMVNEYFLESVGEGKKSIERMTIIENNGPITPRKLAKLFGVSGIGDIPMGKGIYKKWCANLV